MNPVKINTYKIAIPWGNWLAIFFFFFSEFVLKYLPHHCIAKGHLEQAKVANEQNGDLWFEEHNLKGFRKQLKNHSWSVVQKCYHFI